MQKFIGRTTNISVAWNESITIGVAISGGGYRAMLTGAGILSAYDERTPHAEKHVGGILQSTIYLAGISGGLWVVMNNLLSDNRPIFEAVRDKRLGLHKSLLEGVPNVDVSLLRRSIDSNVEVAPSPSEFKRFANITKDASVKNSLVSALLGTFFTSKNKTKVLSTRLTMNFYKELNFEVRAKKNAGFRISLIDYWGRALARRVFPVNQRSPGLTFSSATKLSSFQNYSQPFPIICAVERVPGVLETSKDSHVFEFNPFEFGSWDSFLGAFVEIKYLGSSLWNGLSVDTTGNKNLSVCVAGFDNIGFVTGASSSLFNTLFQYVYRVLMTADWEPSNFLSQFLKIFGLNSSKGRRILPEYALVSPNPFQGFQQNGKGRSITKAESLHLADGGDDGQNIPFHALLVPGRKVDVIFAFDMTSDIYSFPNGTSLQATASRYHSAESALKIPVFQNLNRFKSIFPHVPNQREFVDQNLQSRPVFFGCNLDSDYPTAEIAGSSNQFDFLRDYVPPLIVYTANYDHSYASNTSTFQTSYTPEEVDKMIQNGYNLATYANSTDYSTCIGCAILKRNFDHASKRNAMEMPGFCELCFNRHCYKADR